MAMAQIEKQHGKGSIMRLGDDTTRLGIEAIPTGSLALDLALGVGGLPRGRIVELYGPEGSGKTSLSLHVVAEAQKAGGVVAFIDAEHALDPTYAKALGVDIDNLLCSQPDTGEQALEITDTLVRSGALDVIVIDSVAALVPRAEIEGEMGDTQVGLQARLMSQAMRKLTGSVSRTKTILIFINQIREKIGVTWGSNETTPGGRALKFYSSVRLDVRRIDSLKNGAEIVGSRVRVKVVKNKCIAAGTRVFDPTTGLTHRIEEIVEGGVGHAVWAADKKGCLHVRPICDRMYQGEQDVIPLVLRGGATLKVTPDHLILTDRGWQEASSLVIGDRVARPRRAGTFGLAGPVPPDHARMLGYLIGDGYVGGKTPIAFINTSEQLQEDASRIAESLGCESHRKLGHELYTSFSHRRGEKNGVLELARWAGIWGHLAPEKRIPPAFFDADVSADVVANLLFGIWESDGFISREQSGGIRLGFTTTSEQLAWQIHWLLLRWGITSSMMKKKPGDHRSYIAGRPVIGKLPCWQVRVSGIDNLDRFAQALPMWGPKGRKLVKELGDVRNKIRRGSRAVYLPASLTDPVLSYLCNQGVSVTLAASIVGLPSHARGGWRAVLGGTRLRRDRLEKLAEGLDSEFLRDVLDEEVYYDRILAIGERQRAATYDIEVEELHNLVADDVVVHNCAAPFRKAEFDIQYGTGISKEGSLLDVALEHDIVRKSGAWFIYGDDQLGQGRENAKMFLAENPDIATEIELKIKEKLGLLGTDDNEVAEEPAEK
ncbi:MAG: intein-containing recombinase RecA [Actinomycetota bacterium]